VIIPELERWRRVALNASRPWCSYSIIFQSSTPKRVGDIFLKFNKISWFWKVFTAVCVGLRTYVDTLEVREEKHSVFVLLILTRFWVESQQGMMQHGPSDTSRWVTAQIYLLEQNLEVKVAFSIRPTQRCPAKIYWNCFISRAFLTFSSVVLLEFLLNYCFLLNMQQGSTQNSQLSQLLSCCWEWCLHTICIDLI
jgi:hypothetical protein